MATSPRHCRRHFCVVDATDVDATTAAVDAAAVIIAVPAVDTHVSQSSFLFLQFTFSLLSVVQRIRSAYRIRTTIW